MGERSIQEKYQAWRKCPGMNEELHNQLKAMSPDELNDSFYRSLAFGTGGLRGVLGAGENRMNLYTVSKATRGLGRYLLETCEKPSCAVSCDSRIHSRDFAELTAATLAEMGIRVYLYRTLMPTPMLSYAVRHLHTSAGVMVTASHNPAKFNGYKVYGADGCQITIEAADRIYSFISAEHTLLPFLPDFKKYLDNGMVSYIDDETIESYYQMINGLRIAPTDERLHIGHDHARGVLHDIGLQREHVAGLYLVAELRLVDAGEKAEHPGLIAADERAKRCGLRKRFHDDDARQHRMTREMTREQGQLGVTVELGGDACPGFAFEHAADPHERVAMRQDALDDVAAAGILDGFHG